MYVVVGLGNPGNEYRITRHNIGFLSIDYFAEKNKIKINKLKYKALIGKGKIGDKDIMLVKPQTYMNLSGRSIKDILDNNNIDLQKLLIIYDDMDLELGKIRIRTNGSAGTHNGMKSIIYQVQSEDFPRLRIGIGSCPEGVDAADYVLSHFTYEEQEIMTETIKQVANAVDTIVNDGILTAMNIYN